MPASLERIRGFSLLATLVLLPALVVVVIVDGLNGGREPWPSVFIAVFVPLLLASTTFTAAAIAQAVQRTVPRAATRARMRGAGPAISVFGLLALVANMTVIGLSGRVNAWNVVLALLVGGVVFPLSVLPMPVQALGLVNPLTWWIEGVRHAVFPGGPSAVGGAGSLWTQLTGTAGPDGATILVALLATGALVTLAATGVFRVSERRAKDRGLLDRTTGS